MPIPGTPQSTDSYRTGLTYPRGQGKGDLRQERRRQRWRREEVNRGIRQK